MINEKKMRPNEIFQNHDSKITNDDKIGRINYKIQNMKIELSSKYFPLLKLVYFSQWTRQDVESVDVSTLPREPCQGKSETVRLL